MTRRLEIINQRSGGRLRASLRWALLMVFAAGVALTTLVVGVYVIAARTVPVVPPFDQVRPGGMTLVHAHDGQVIGEYFEERRLDLDFEDIPAGLVLAILATEDARFFGHSGYDLRGLLRAAWANLQARAFVEGASTITQQLAKSILGRPEDFGRDAQISLIQKAREAIYGRRIEDAYTKEQILLLYLNRIYFGHSSYGIRAAAQNYFRKDLSELNLTETALLAGLPQAPSRLNPLRNPERARTRLEHVLNRMYQSGFISDEERREASAATLLVFPLKSAVAEGAPYFVNEVVKELQARFKEQDDPDAWRRRELRVETTIDLAWQRAAEEHLALGIEELDRKQGYRGPLVNLPPAEHERFSERVEAALRGDTPAPGSFWPALVVEVAREGIAVRLGTSEAERLPLADFAWAAPYRETPKPSFQGRLRDPREVFSKGDVVLVRVDGEDAARRLRLFQVPLVEGALLALEHETGYVKALQGGWDFDRNEVNRCRSLRQTGSAIKPLIYSLAYDLGLPPSTLLSSAPFRDGDYAPARAGREEAMIVWDALTTSDNNISLRVMNFVQRRAGVARLQRWARSLGLSHPLQGYTAEVLGVDQTPLGMTRMMASFAAGGREVVPRIVRKITDRTGRVFVRPTAFDDPFNDPPDVLDALHEELAASPVQAISATTAHLTAANLREVFRRGTARHEGRLMRVPAAGKTGTLEYDVWFTGFTADLAATVWIGADRRERALGTGGRRARVYGANTALPVWRRFIDAALAERPGATSREPVLPPPDDVAVVMVDPTSGRRAGPGLLHTRAVPHRRGTEPAPMATIGTDSTDALQTEF